MEPDTLLFYSLFAFALVMIELLYFRVAFRFNIIDRPNHRSSHGQDVIRGGGIIMVVGVLAWGFYNGPWPWFMSGFLLIAFFSFLDDVISLKAWVRFLAQFVAVLLLFYQFYPMPWPGYLFAMAIIVCVGTLNAYNFMDGINGISGIYTTVMLFAFLYIEKYVIDFTEASFIISLLLSVIVFLFFNFRKKAKCFAGDVGSVSLAFVLVFLLIQLILATHDFYWPLLFLVYGTDSIVTIIYRLKRKENIFQPHRSHLYQYLTNEFKWPHQGVSLMYGGIQMLLNVFYVAYIPKGNHLIPIVVSLAFVALYFYARSLVHKKIFSVIKTQA